MSNLKQKPQNSLMALMAPLFVKKEEPKENISTVAQNAKTLGAVFGEVLGKEIGQGKTPPKNLNIAPTKLIPTNNGFVGLRKDESGKPQVLGNKKQVGNFVAQTLPKKINNVLGDASQKVNAHYDALKASGEYDLNDLEAARKDELSQLQNKLSKAGETVVKSTDNATNADKRAGLNATKLATGKASDLKTQLGANQFLQNIVEDARTVGDATKTGALKEVAGYAFTPKAINEEAKRQYNQQQANLQNLAKSDNPIISNYAKAQLAMAATANNYRQGIQGALDKAGNLVAKIGQPLQAAAEYIEAAPEVQSRIQNNPMAATAGDFVGRAIPYIAAEAATGGGMSDALIANAGLKALTSGIKNAGARKIAQRALAGGIENAIQGQLADPGVQYLETGTYNPIQSLQRLPADILLGGGFGGSFEAGGRALRNATIAPRANDILGTGATKRAETRTAALQALTEDPTLKPANPEKVAQIQAQLEAIQNEKSIKAEIGKLDDVAKLEKQEAKLAEELKYETDPNFRNQKDYSTQLDQNLNEVSSRLKALEQEKTISGLVDENQVAELRQTIQKGQLEKQLIASGKTPQEAKAYIDESIRKADSAKRQQQLELEAKQQEALRLKEEAQNTKLSQAKLKNQERYSSKAATQLELLAAKQESGRALTPLDLKKVEIVARNLPDESPVKQQFEALKTRFEGEKTQRLEVQKIDKQIKDIQNQYRSNMLTKEAAVRNINNLKAQKAKLLNATKKQDAPSLNNADASLTETSPAPRQTVTQTNNQVQTAALNQPLPEAPISDVNIPAKARKPQAPRATAEERAVGDALLQDESRISEYPASDLLEAAGIRLQVSKDPNFYNVNTGKGYIKIAKGANFKAMPEEVKNLIRSRSKQILNNPRFREILDDATNNLREAKAGQPLEAVYKQNEKAANDVLSKADNQFDELANEADNVLKEFDNVKSQKELDDLVARAYDDKFEALGEDFYNKLGERLDTAQTKLGGGEAPKADMGIPISKNDNMKAPASEKPIADALLKPTRYDYARTKPPEMKTWGEYWNYVNDPKNYSTLDEIGAKEKINIEGAQKQADELATVQKDYKVAQASQKQAEEALFRRVLRDEKLKAKLEAGEVVTVKAEYGGQTGQIPLAMKKGELYIPAEIKGRLEELKANYADVIDDVSGKDGVLNIHQMTEAKSQASTGKTIDEAASEFLKWRIETDALKANRDELKKGLYSEFLRDNFENKGIDLRFKDSSGNSVFYITKPAAKTLSYKDSPVTIPDDFGRLAGKTFNNIQEAENAIKAEFGIRKADVLGTNFSKTKGVPANEKIKLGNLVEKRQAKLKEEAQIKKDFETRSPESANQAAQGLDYTLKQIDEGNKVDKALADETINNLDKLNKQFAFNPLAIPIFGTAAKAIISGQGLADTIELAANAGIIPAGFYKNLDKTVKKLTGIDRFKEVMEGVIFNAPKTIDENLANIGRARGQKAGIHGEFIENFARLEARIRKFDTDMISKDEKIFQQVQDLINSKGIDEILDSEGKLKEQYKDNLLGIYVKTRFEIKKDLIEYADNYKQKQIIDFNKLEKELKTLEAKKQLSAVDKQRLKDLKTNKENLEKSLVYLDDKIAHLKLVGGNSIFDKIQGMGYQAVLWNNPSVAALNIFDFLQVRADGRIMGDKGALSALPFVNEMDKAAGYLFKEALTGNKNKDSILNYFGAKKTGSYNDVIAIRKSYKQSNNIFEKAWDFVDSIEMNKLISEFNQDAILVASARNWRNSSPEFKKLPDPVSNYTAFKQAAPDSAKIDFIKHITLDQGLLSGTGASGADFALGGLAKEPVAKQVITFIKPAYRVAANLRRNWQTLIESITPEENGKLLFKPQNLARPEAQKAAASLVANLGGLYMVGGTTAALGVPGFGAVINAFMKLANPEEKDQLEENLNKFSLGYNYAPGFGKRLQIQNRSIEKNSVVGLVKDRFSQLTEPLAGSYINQLFGVWDKVAKYGEEVEAGRAEWSEFPKGEILKMAAKILPTQAISKLEQYLSEEFKAIYSDKGKGAFPKKLGEVPTKGDAALLLSGSNKRAEQLKKIDEAEGEAKRLIAGFEGNQPAFKRDSEILFNQNLKRLSRLTGANETEIKKDLFKKAKASLRSKNALGSLSNPGSLGTSTFKARIANLPAPRRQEIINKYQAAYYTEKNPQVKSRIQSQLKAARSIKEAVNF